jgi:hypothetical protein
LALKKTSRVAKDSKFGKLQTDDWLFWTDWTVAGTLALASLLIASSANGVVPTVQQQSFGLVYIVLGYFVLPNTAKAILYTGDGEFASGRYLKSVRSRIACVNGLAFVILLFAVSLGAKVYG